jgi:predicted ATPase/DNA-binding SARP family transcriptional activator
MAGGSAAIEFRVLGAVEAFRDGAPVPLGGPRQRALLALLLIEPRRRIASERLADELWQGNPPSGAATLQSYVSRLRSALAEDVTIASVAGGYTIDVEPERVDAKRFERLVDEARAAVSRGTPRRAAERFHAALAHWRGEPFAALPEVAALQAEGRRLEALRIEAFEELIEAELQLGRDAELVDEIEALVAEHPYRERLWRQLMLALYRAERQADALAAYRRARRLLDEELGVEPSEELRALEQAILRHEVPTVPKIEERHNLPAALTSFVGRDRELVDIEHLLGETRLLTLTGVGGVGKTRLALEVAHRGLPDFADGVYFVDFSALADSDLVPQHVAAALGVREHGDVEMAEMLVGRLREAQLLLVLDNCEHLREPVAELAHGLLRAAARVRVLATSREPLGAPGELDHPVPPMDPSEGAQLFLARARAARPGLSEDERALTSATRICEMLDGLPLALELAAVRAKALSLEEIAARLADRFRFLVSWRRLAPARHRTLREAMDWSYELLSEDEGAAFARLSVFAGGFTLDAVAAVCLNGDDERALDLIERLVQASLVVAEEGEGETRYRLLETVREYAAHRLEEGGIATATKDAHVRFFCDLADSAALRGPDQGQWLARLDADLDNLRAAIDTAAATGDPESELRLVGSLGRYWWIRGLLTEGRTRIAAALARGSGLPVSLRANPLHRAAGLAYAQDDYERARPLAIEALEAARASGDIQAEMAANTVLGATAMEQQDYAAARRHFSESLSLAERHGLGEDEMTGEMNLGIAAVYSGDAREALQILGAILVAARQAQSPEAMGLALLHLGLAAYQLGDDEAARASWEETREVLAGYGFPQHVAHALQGLAAVDARAGSHVSAARLLGWADLSLGGAGASAHDAFGSRVAVYAEAEARKHLGDDAFRAAWEEGRQQEAARL